MSHFEAILEVRDIAKRKLLQVSMNHLLLEPRPGYEAEYYHTKELISKINDIIVHVAKNPEIPIVEHGEIK